MDGEALTVPLRGRRPASLGDIEDDAALGQSSIGQRDVRADPAAGGHDRGGRGQRRHADEALPGRPAAGAGPTVLDETEPEELSSGRVAGRRRPADRDDAQRRRQRLRHAPRRSPASRSPARPAPRRTRRTTAPHNWFIGFAPPTTRRSPSRCSSPTAALGSGPPAARVGRADRPPGHAGRTSARGAPVRLLSQAAAGRAATRSPRPIALGGMGEVWRAATGAATASSRPRCSRASSPRPEFLARFRNEARHTAALTHPNIAHVYDYGETVDDTGRAERLAFLVMELVEGQPLAAILHGRAGCRRPDAARAQPVRRRAVRRRTGPAWCTATSSRATCWSARTAS